MPMPMPLTGAQDGSYDGYAPYEGAAHNPSLYNTSPPSHLASYNYHANPPLSNPYQSQSSMPPPSPPAHYSQPITQSDEYDSKSWYTTSPTSDNTASQNSHSRGTISPRQSSTRSDDHSLEMDPFPLPHDSEMHLPVEPLNQPAANSRPTRTHAHLPIDERKPEYQFETHLPTISSHTEVYSHISDQKKHASRQEMFDTPQSNEDIPPLPYSNDIGFDSILPIPPFPPHVHQQEVKSTTHDPLPVPSQIINPLMHSSTGPLRKDSNGSESPQPIPNFISQLQPKTSSSDEFYVPPSHIHAQSTAVHSTSSSVESLPKPTSSIHQSLHSNRQRPNGRNSISSSGPSHAQSHSSHSSTNSHSPAVSSTISLSSESNQIDKPLPQIVDADKLPIHSNKPHSTIPLKQNDAKETKGRYFDPNKYASLDDYKHFILKKPPIFIAENDHMENFLFST